MTLGDQKLDLRLGQWSPVFELKFKAGFAFTVHAVTQVILTEVKDRVSLYFVPLQIHPLHSCGTTPRRRAWSRMPGRSAAAT